MRGVARKQILLVNELILQRLQLLLLALLQVLLPRHVPQLRHKRVLLLLRAVLAALDLLRNRISKVSAAANQRERLQQLNPF
jgi:hypothetical protein